MGRKCSAEKWGAVSKSRGGVREQKGRDGKNRRDKCRGSNAEGLTRAKKGVVFKIKIKRLAGGSNRVKVLELPS